VGHQKLANGLPRSKRWIEVISLIGAGAEVGPIAGATARAAETGMTDVSNDAAVRHAFWLLAQIPTAARDIDFKGALAGLGVLVPDQASLEDIVAGAADRLASAARKGGGGSDYGEMAQLSFAESLYAIASRESDLFGDHPDRIRAALARLATPNQFAVLARDFFARLTRRHLSYYLSRELIHHVGTNRRFVSLADTAAFDAALDLHCREASRIIKEFSAEWFSKHTFEGGIDPGKAGRFVHVAARKIRDELRERSRVLHA
jgi:hypothetical protein